MMADHWRPEDRLGHTVPSATVYPWQWLWDSCFHAVLWAELGDGDRALAELASALSDQDELGFVPHIRYVGDPAFLASFWGRPATSSLTQPPMYGHAVAALRRRGVEVPEDLVGRARAGVRFLLDHRARTSDGLVTVVHPWETGGDDSPRWDDWSDGGRFDRADWFERKGELLASVERSSGGAPLANPAFRVAPAGFNALIAFNAACLGLEAEATELAEALEARWDDDLCTWVDGPHPSGRVRTLDALLPALVTPTAAHRRRALATAAEDRAFGGRFGPAGVHRDEPSFDPTGYWRGAAWPQLTYLLWLAGATDLGPRLVAGAERSGLAEYWHPDTGKGLGARPQSWAGLAMLVDGNAS